MQEPDDTPWRPKHEEIAYISIKNTGVLDGNWTVQLLIMLPEIW
jgi:hypothetical protein